MLRKFTAFAVALALLTSTAGAAAADGEDWPTYHHTADHVGVAAAGSTFSDAQTSWTTGGLDGAVYAEPLYVGGKVLVATENNTLYAFDATNGGPLWQTHLADPVDAGSLPCGNIRPTVGITGTPTVDVGVGVLYAAAMVSGARYVLFAVDINSGGVVFQRPLDQQLLDARSAGQRGALALEQGHVYVPFGGRFGDCGDYRGQVVAASGSDPNAPLMTYTTPAHRTGMWQAGGLPIGGDGTVFAVTGNGDADGPSGRTEAVLALSPTLEEMDSWQPADWKTLDSADRDVGSVAPALLQDLGLIFQSGKNGRGYLLRIGALGGVGGEIVSDGLPGGCGGVFGGTAYAPPLLIVPCGKSLVALNVAGDPQPGFSLAWRGPDEVGQPEVGSPIIVAGTVWNIDYGGRVRVLDLASGAQRLQIDLPPGLPGHFASLAYGGGQVYAATPAGVVAYQLIGLTSST